MVETMFPARSLRQSDLIEASKAIRDSLLERIQPSIDRAEERLEETLLRTEQAEKRLADAERRFQDGEQGILLKASKSFYAEFDRSLGAQTEKLNDASAALVTGLQSQLEDCNRRIDEMQRHHELQLSAIRESHLDGFAQIAAMLRAMPVPTVQNNLPELKPEIHVEVNPTPIQVMPSTVENRIEVQPAVVENRIEVNPTPVTVDNQVHVPVPPRTRKVIQYDESSRPVQTLEYPMEESV